MTSLSQTARAFASESYVHIFDIEERRGVESLLADALRCFALLISLFLLRVKQLLDIEV